MKKDCRVKLANVAEKIKDESTETKYSSLYVHKALSTRGNNELMTIMARLNGIPMKIAIDSGCTTSIMSTDTFEKYKDYLIYRKSDEKIKTANDQISTVKGKLLDVEVEIANHVCKLDMLIFDHTDHDVLLGLDYCQITNICIFPGENMIRFPNEKVYMDTDSKDPYVESDHMVLTTAETIGDGEKDWWDELEWTSKDEKQQLNLRNYFKPEIQLDKGIDFWKLVSPMIDISALGFEDLDTCTVQKLEINIKPNTTPIYLPPYRKSIAEREIIKQEVQKMLDAKVIEPCS